MSESAYPTLPPEFFSIEELIAALGPQRRAGLIQVLKDANVSFIVGSHGWPLVYRDKLSPASAAPASDMPVVSTHNFDAIHGSSRTSSHRRQ